MPPIPAEWWLRPVSIACRVGEQSAVVWKRLYFSPPEASFSKLGVAHGPPKALDAAKPTSSSRTINTLGAPLGGRRGSIGRNFVFGSLASYVVRPVCLWDGMGRMLLEGLAPLDMGISLGDSARYTPDN